MDFELSGRHALVTGASSGLGLAIAQSLLAEGASVTLAARSAEKLQAAVEALPEAQRARCDTVVAEFGAPGAVEAMLQAAVRQTGRVDILVANTGGPPPGQPSAIDPDVMAAQYGKMIDPVVRLTLALVPGMRERGWGRVLTVTSSGVIQPIPHLPMSNTLRASLVGFMKSLAGEVAADGVTVNVLAPGRIATARTAELDAANAAKSGKTVEEVARASAASIPAGRYGSPAEFGAVAAFLASGPAAYVTGSTIRIDGGAIRAV